MGKKINELTAVSTATASQDTQLFALADPTSGIAGKMTVAQAKAVYQTQTKLYTATGAEGVTLAVAEIVNKKIVAMFRESGPIFQVASSPASAEFTFNLTTITLGTAVGGAGERFLILYTTI